MSLCRRSSDSMDFALVIYPNDHRPPKARMHEGTFKALRLDHPEGFYVSLSLRIAAMTRGLRRPCITATTQRGFSSGA